MMKIKELEYKKEQEQKEVEAMMAEQRKLLDLERKREESKQRIIERKQ